MTVRTPRAQTFRYMLVVRPTRTYVDDRGEPYWAFDGDLRYMGKGVGAINGVGTAEECFALLIQMRDRRIKEHIDEASPGRST